MDAVREAGIMDDTVVILTADHGGIETGHGGKTMNEMQTPIVFYGKNVKKGFKIPESTMVYDIAGTMAYLLDVPGSRRCGSPVRYYQLSRIIKNIDHEESYLFFYFSFLRRINLTGGDNGGCHL